MNNDLISRSALIEVLEEMANDEWNISVGSSKGLEDAIDVIDNAPTVEAYTEEDIKQTIKENFDIGYEMAKNKYTRTQGECEKCDYYTFAQAFINGIVEVMSKNGITTVEELLETLKGDAE